MRKSTRREAEADAEARRVREQADAEAVQVQAVAEARAYEERVKAAEALEGHPALLRMAELETLRELARNANARLYLGFDRNGLALDGSGSQAERFVKEANRLQLIIVNDREPAMSASSVPDLCLASVMDARWSSEPQDGVRFPGGVLRKNMSLECAGFAREPAKLEDQVRFLAGH